MINEINDLYYCLGKLEEAYCVDSANSQECLAAQDARMKMEAAIINVSVLLANLISQRKNQKKQRC